MGLKVALSGTGGDELFGGYTSFRDIPRWMPVTSVLSRIPGLGEGVYRLNTALAKRSRHISPKMGEILRHGSSYAGAYLVKRGRFLTSELPEVLGDGHRPRRNRAPEPARDPRARGHARSRHAVRARGRARVVALPAQSTAARHGLGQHGPLARSARAARRRAPAAQARAGARHAQRAAAKQILANAPRPAASGRACARAARPASRSRSRNGCSRKGASSSASAAGRARCTR